MTPPPDSRTLSTGQRPRPYRPATLSHLRSMAPERPATFDESLRLAARQAEALANAVPPGSVPAVPIETITSRHRIRLEYPIDQRLPSVGFWDTSTRQWVIELPWDADWAAKRYAIAQEFKRILDYHHANTLYTGTAQMSAAYQADEAARQFAAHLLVPTTLLRLAVARDSAITLAELALRFQVPDSIVRQRLSEAGITTIGPHRPSVARNHGSAR